MRNKTSVLVLALLLGSSSTLAETTVSWWQFWTDPGIKPTIDSIVAEFELANPDIEVELTDLTWSNGHEKIAIGFASETGPDVVELGSDWIAQFADNDRLADLSEHIASDSSDYHGWAMATYQGNVYAKPWILGTRVLYVNRDLLARTELGADFLPIGWSELYGSAKMIMDLGDGIYGWGSNTAEKHRLYKKFLPMFWSNNARIFTPDGRYCIVSSEMAVKALDFYKALHDTSGYVSNQRGIEDAFLDGKIGFIMSGDWLLKRIETENHQINFATTLIPGPNAKTSGTAFPGLSFMGGEFLAVNADSPVPDAARKLIDWVTKPDNQVRFCRANHTANPSSRIAQQDEYFNSNEHLRMFIYQIARAQAPPVDPDWVHIEAEIEAAVEDALFGSGLPATALRNAQINITKLKKK